MSNVEPNGKLGQKREVTLVHYSGWRAHIPKREDELTGYAEVTKCLTRFYLFNRESGKKALIHCKQGYVRTMTVVMTICRFLQRIYGIDLKFSFKDMINTLKKKIASHLFDGFKGRQIQDYSSFADNFSNSVHASGMV